MNSSGIEKANRGFGFIEIILVLAVIFFLCYKVFALYFKESMSNIDNRKVLSEAGINTSSNKTIIDSTRKKVEEYNLKVEGQNKELENINKENGSNF